MGSSRPNRWRRAKRACAPTRGLGALLVAHALALACDFPEPEACALACGPAGECPSAFECQPETLLCAPRGQSEPCTSTPISPGGDDGEATPDAGEPAPNEPAPSVPGDAGEGSGPGEPPSRAPSIASSRVSDACTGDELALELVASGGEPPYAWRLSAPAGVSLTASSGSVVALAGAPETAGQVLVELVDAAGRRAVTERIAIRQRPSIDTSTLPALCAGAGYRAPLDGWGGDADTRVWSARLVGDDTRSLEALGLEVVGSSLSAVSIPTDLEPGTVRLQLGLSDGWCEADDVELAVELTTLDAEACPSIAIAGQASGRLPTPCRGNRYTEVARVEGGVPPFTWTELASPPGLYLDEVSGVVDGIPSAGGELALAVTDGDGRTVEAFYDVSVRDRCWLAYVAGGVAPARLELVDPLLLERQPENARRRFPESGAAAVQDYRFSPDGRFIAYRSGLATDALGVVLVRVVDGATAPVVLPEPAAEYAWSMDSGILFVATGTEERVLRAIDVSASGERGDTLGEQSVIGTRSMPMPSGPFTAFGDRALAFLTPDASAPQRMRLVTSGVLGSAIAPLSTRTELDFSASARVEGGPAGVLVTDPETGVAAFFPGVGGVPVAHADALASGSSALFARADAGNLALFDAANASTPLFAAAGCARLLARATDGERFACASDRPGLAFFALSPSGLGTSTAPGATGDRLGQRRVFSAGGRWFASPDADGLAVWSLEPDGPRRAALIPSTVLGAAASTLSFSPDETRLIIGAGNQLRMLDLGGSQASLLELSSSALLDAGCSERASDGLDGWCGSDSGLSVLRWAPSSDAVAFRSVLGTLAVIDTTGADDGRIGRALAPDADCEEACISSTSARFQP